MSIDTTTTKTKRSVAATWSFAAILIVIIAELTLNIFVIPHYRHIINGHPKEIIGKGLIPTVLTIANMTSLAAIFALLSMVGVAYLVNQRVKNATALIWAVLLALLGMWQMNASTEIENEVQRQNPYAIWVAGTLKVEEYPGIAIAVVAVAFLIWYFVTKRVKVQSP
jgi:hypothetical protein